MTDEMPQSITRAVAILDCFSQETPQLGVREIARLINLSPSSAGRIMVALREMGILNQNPRTHLYSLGSRVLAWAGVYSSNLDVRNIALPFMEDLRQKTGETISLYIREGTDRVCVERYESNHTVSFVTRIGRRLPLYAGAAGKVLLAFLDPDKQRQVIETIPLMALTTHTITDMQVLMAELQRIRIQGFAVSFGEWAVEAAGIAAPIFSHSQEVTAALTISGPIQRFTPENMERFTVELTHSAHEISGSLGYPG